jgi:hypothetical protein
MRKDIICLIGGTSQAPIAAAFPDHRIVEFGSFTQIGSVTGGTVTAPVGATQAHVIICIQTVAVGEVHYVAA